MYKSRELLFCVLWVYLRLEAAICENNCQEVHHMTKLCTSQEGSKSSSEGRSLTSTRFVSQTPLLCQKGSYLVIKAAYLAQTSDQVCSQSSNISCLRKDISEKVRTVCHRRQHCLPEVTVELSEKGQCVTSPSHNHLIVVTTRCHPAITTQKIDICSNSQDQYRSFTQSATLVVAPSSSECHCQVSVPTTAETVVRIKGDRSIKGTMADYCNNDGVVGMAGYTWDLEELRKEDLMLYCSYTDNVFTLRHTPSPVCAYNITFTTVPHETITVRCRKPQSQTSPITSLTSESFKLLPTSLVKLGGITSPKAPSTVIRSTLSIHQSYPSSSTTKTTSAATTAKTTTSSTSTSTTTYLSRIMTTAFIIRTKLVPLWTSGNRSSTVAPLATTEATLAVQEKEDMSNVVILGAVIGGGAALILMIFTSVVAVLTRNKENKRTPSTIGLTETNPDNERQVNIYQEPRRNRRASPDSSIQVTDISSYPDPYIGTSERSSTVSSSHGYARLEDFYRESNIDLNQNLVNTPERRGPTRDIDSCNSNRARPMYDIHIPIARDNIYDDLPQPENTSSQGQVAIIDSGDYADIANDDGDNVEISMDSTPVYLTLIP